MPQRCGFIIGHTVVRITKVGNIALHKGLSESANSRKAVAKRQVAGSNTG